MKKTTARAKLWGSGTIAIVTPPTKIHDCHCLAPFSATPLEAIGGTEHTLMTPSRLAIEAAATLDDA